ncbi:MAG: 4Fe-4S dicluster domain-containing protein [Acidobacteriota bacterium]
MRYGFIIDQRKCIGCHACTVACKSENSVPLGNFRTWVKYIESGHFPNTQRHFAVLRCNHCDNAPCVRICPVTALYTRTDGIVDFDAGRCIGCKACMQACPYDALYINPYTNTAEKCNYCAHRVEVGLEPACVIVCPEQAIVAGDLDNPNTPITQLLQRERAMVRKPEQGTQPKLYYLGSHKNALRPELQQRPPIYMWSQPGAAHGAAIDLQQFIAEAQEKSIRTAYDVPHERPWGWRVYSYLWTKSIAAGTFLLPAAMFAWSETKEMQAALQIGTTISLIFQMLTAILLVVDLKRPDRFLNILLKPQWRSWLAIGAYILVFFTGVSGLCWLALFTGYIQVAYWLALPGILLAIMAAIYSGFLFAQAEGRDFWQSRLTTPHLAAQALVAGAATFGLAAPLLPTLPIGYLSILLPLGLIVHITIMLAEVLSHSPTPSKRQLGDAARACALLTRGPYRSWFWGGAVTAGALLPAALALLAAPASITIASLVALAGLLLYEALWIKVGQAIPLS